MIKTGPVSETYREFTYGASKQGRIQGITYEP